MGISVGSIIIISRAARQGFLTCVSNACRCRMMWLVGCVKARGMAAGLDPVSGVVRDEYVLVLYVCTQLDPCINLGLLWLMLRRSSE